MATTATPVPLDLPIALARRIADGGVAANRWLTTTANVDAEAFLTALVIAFEQEDGYARYHRFTDRSSYDRDIAKALREADLDFLHTLHCRRDEHGNLSYSVARLLDLLDEQTRQELVFRGDRERASDLGLMLVGFRLSHSTAS